MRVRGFNNVGKAAQTDPNCCATLRRSRNKRNVGSCWLKSLTCFKLCARATTCNKVDKRTQHVLSNNVGSCQPRKLCPFARGFTWQEGRKKRVTGLNRQEDSPKTSSRLSVMPRGEKRIPAQRAGKKQKTSENITLWCTHLLSKSSHRPVLT